MVTLDQATANEAWETWRSSGFRATVDVRTMALALLKAARSGYCVCEPGHDPSGPGANRRKAALAALDALADALDGGAEPSAEVRAALAEAMALVPQSWRTIPAGRVVSTAAGLSPQASGRQHQRRVSEGDNAYGWDYVYDTGTADLLAVWRSPTARSRCLYLPDRQLRNLRGFWLEGGGEIHPLDVGPMSDFDISTDGQGSRKTVLAARRARMGRAVLEAWRATLPPGGAVEEAQKPKQVLIRLPRALMERIAEAAALRVVESTSEGGRPRTMSAKELMRAAVLSRAPAEPMADMGVPSREAGSTTIDLTEAEIAALDAEASALGESRNALILGKIAAALEW